MDEPKERDVSSGTNSESSVTVSEKLSTETLVDSDACVGKEDAEGTSNGADIMVQVLGSDVYVDGVCSNRSGKNLDEVSQDRSVDAKSPDGQTRVEKSSGDGESMEEITEIGVSGGEENIKIQNVVEKSLGDGDSTEGKTKETELQEDGERSVEVREVKKVEVGSDENRVVVGFVGDGISSVESQKFERSRTENGLSGESVVVGRETAGNLERELVEENGGVGKQLDDGGIDDQKTGKVCGWIPEALSTEESTAEEQAIEEKDSVMVDQEGLNPKDVVNLERDPKCVVGVTHGVSGKDDFLDAKSESLDEQSQDADGLGELKDFEGTNSISQPTQGKSIAKVEVMNGAEVLNPNVEVASENDQNLKVEKMESRNIESDTQDSYKSEIDAMDTEEKSVPDDLVETDFKNEEEKRVDTVIKSDQVEEEMEVVTDNNTEMKSTEDNIVKPEDQKYQASYQLPTENEGDFSVSDLVWGKVRSHPWWPGQIFDPSDASEKAMKHYKKDCFLVAYFGDRTFAWNEESHLKRLRTNFTQVEKQSNSEAFQNAVDCALEEVSRRIDLGLACSCIEKDIYDKIKFQIIENGGIREESSRRVGVDESASAFTFEPTKLIEFLRELAKFPSGGGDRLELVIAQAQLGAYYRLKGYCSLPQFEVYGGLVENSSDPSKMHSSEFIKEEEQASSSQEILKVQNRSSSHKRKHNLKDGLYLRKKERSLSELMDESFDLPDGENWSDGKTTVSLASPSYGKKRKAADDSMTPDGRKTISFTKVSNTTPPKQSFKIGDCIRRVASQLTGTPTVKNNSDKLQSIEEYAVDGNDAAFQNFEDSITGRVNFTTEYPSLGELLSQLQVAAIDPLKIYNFLNTIVGFFSDFRDSVITTHVPEVEHLGTDKVGGKRKAPNHPNVASSETFEFEDMSDTYWTDRVIQNGSEEQPSRKNRKKDYQLVLADTEKSVPKNQTPYSRKQYSVGNHSIEAEKPVGYVNVRSPAELIMNFSEVHTVPSESNLNRMFRRFGPLNESETEVDRVGGRAKVVFKKCSHAEVAFSSVQQFNIFGATVVNYQLSYTPTPSIKAYSPISTTQDHLEMHLDLTAAQFQEMQLDLGSIQDHEMQLDLAEIHDQNMQLDLASIQYQEMDAVFNPIEDNETEHYNFTSMLREETQPDVAQIPYEEERQHDCATLEQETPIISTTHQEIQPNLLATQEEYRPDISSIQEQDYQTNLATTQEQEYRANLARTSEPDWQADLATPQVLEVQLNIATTTEELEPDLATIQGETKESDFIATQELELPPDDFATAQAQEAEPTHPTIEEKDEKPGHALTQEKNEQSDNDIAMEQMTIQEREKQPDDATALEQEEQSVHAIAPEPISSQEQENLPDHATTQELDVQSNHATALEPTTIQEQENLAEHATSQQQDAQFDQATAPEPITTQEQENLPGLATTQEQEEEYGHATALDEAITLEGDEQADDADLEPTTTQELEKPPRSTSSLNLEKQPNHATLRQHESQSNHATTQQEEAQSEHATTQQDEAQSDHPTALQEAQPDHAMAQPDDHDTTPQQEAQPDDHDTIPQQEAQPDDHDMTPQQEAQPDDHSILQCQEAQSDQATIQDKEKHSNDAPTRGHKKQADHVTTQQRQADDVTSPPTQEWEKQPDSPTSFDSKTDSDLPTTFDSKAHSDLPTDQDQEVLLDVSSLETSMA